MSRLVLRDAITPTNQSPVFLIVTWISQAAVLLAVGVKVLLSYTSTGIHTDDWCILVAAALSIVQVVAASIQGLNGTGRVQASLTHHEVTTYQKAAYAAEILYVLNLAISKLAVILFLFKITPFKLWRRTTAFVGVFITLWGLSSVFVVAFQCRSPGEWEFLQNHCINRNAFWTANSALNMAIELALIFVPITMFFALISSTYNKLILMLCFSLRFSVIAVVALQLYYIYHPVYPPESSTPFDEANDYTFSTWPVFLTAQIIQSLSIITTCVPFMRNLFLGLETGMIQTGHVSRRKMSAAVTGRFKDRSTKSSNRLSNWRSNPNDPANATLQLANFRFNTNDAGGSAPLLDSNQTSNGSTADSYSRRSSDASTLTENARSSHELILNRRSSSSTNDSSRTPTTPTFPRRGSEGSNRPGLEHSYSRRQVSMIVEEEEESHRTSVPPVIPDTTPMLEEDVEDEYPETAPHVRTSTGRLSTIWRSSCGSDWSISGELDESKSTTESGDSVSHEGQESRAHVTWADHTQTTT